MQPMLVWLFLGECIAVYSYFWGQAQQDAILFGNVDERRETTECWF